MIDEKAIVNGVVGAARHRRLDQPHHAPGGHRRRRRNHSTWDDIAELSRGRAAARPDLPQRHAPT